MGSIVCLLNTSIPLDNVHIPLDNVHNNGKFFKPSYYRSPNTAYLEFIAFDYSRLVIIERADNFMAVIFATTIIYIIQYTVYTILCILYTNVYSIYYIYVYIIQYT